jgi:hypothetical protein
MEVQFHGIAEDPSEHFEAAKASDSPFGEFRDASQTSPSTFESIVPAAR